MTAKSQRATWRVLIAATALTALAYLLASAVWWTWYTIKLGTFTLNNGHVQGRLERVPGKEPTPLRRRLGALAEPGARALGLDHIDCPPDIEAGLRYADATIRGQYQVEITKTRYLLGWYVVESASGYAWAFHCDEGVWTQQPAPGCEDTTPPPRR